MIKLTPHNASDADKAKIAETIMNHTYMELYKIELIYGQGTVETLNNLGLLEDVLIGNITVSEALESVLPKAIARQQYLATAEANKG